MSGACLSNMACLIFSTGSDSSVTGFEHWMRPALSLRGMESFLERQRVTPSKFSDVTGAWWRNRADPRRRGELRRSEPPGDRDFLVGVELDRVLPVRLEVAEE